MFKTIGNTQFGGVHEGLVNDAYQVGISGYVMLPLRKPTPKHNAKHTPRRTNERNVMSHREEGLELVDLKPGVRWP
jgi:hypothetical protein